MTEERRKMNEILKEVDDFFQKCGVLDAIEAFLHSKDVTNRVEDATTKLISNIKQMENSAPNDEIKALANEVRTDLESDHVGFINDILSTFKVNFASTLHLIVEMTDDTMWSFLIDSVKSAIPKKGMMDINDICATLIEMYSNEFMVNIYRDYVPDDMPDAVANFIRTFFGDVMIPLNINFSETVTGDDHESSSD